MTLVDAVVVSAVGRWAVATVAVSLLLLALEVA